MDFKSYLENDEFQIDTNAEVLDDLKNLSQINSSFGNISRHNVLDQSRQFYIDDLTNFFVRLFEKLKEKFIKFVNNYRFIKILKTMKITKKINKISEIVVMFLADSSFAKYLMKKFPKLRGIVNNYKERDEFLRKEVVGNETLFI
jgi:hypothetical protein